MLGHRPRILAWGSGPEHEVAGLPEVIAVRAGEWKCIGYHQVVRGGWRPSDMVLWWEDDQGSHEIPLDEPGRLPELFMERVAASIVFDQVIGKSGMQARLVARRDLGDKDNRLVWHAWPLGDTVAETAEYAAWVDQTIAKLSLDYGIG